jgi:hypothetical protein
MTSTREQLVVVGGGCVEHLGRLRMNSISFDLILI